MTSSKPRLDPKVRLRFDRRTESYLLLYPETGLELNRTATEIVQLFNGERTADEMVDHLARTYVDVAPDDIRRDLEGFLRTLAVRGLLL